MRYWWRHIGGRWNSHMRTSKMKFSNLKIGKLPKKDCNELKTFYFSFALLIMSPFVLATLISLSIATRGGRGGGRFYLTSFPLQLDFSCAGYDFWKHLPQMGCWIGGAWFWKLQLWKQLAHYISQQILTHRMGWAAIPLKNVCKQLKHRSNAWSICRWE